MTIHWHSFIDITSDICPMTFVKTKLAIERIEAGEILKIRLKGSEPLDNVPASLIDHGHEIISQKPENSNQTSATGVHILYVIKN